MPLNDLDLTLNRILNGTNMASDNIMTALVKLGPDAPPELRQTLRELMSTAHLAQQQAQRAAQAYQRYMKDR